MEHYPVIWGLYDKPVSRWWFQNVSNIFFIFTPKLGEDFPFDEHIFQMG